MFTKPVLNQFTAVYELDFEVMYGEIVKQDI